MALLVFCGTFYFMAKKVKYNRAGIRRSLISKVLEKGIIVGYDGRPIREQKVAELGIIYSQLINQPLPVTKKSVWTIFEYLCPIAISQPKPAQKKKEKKVRYLEPSTASPLNSIHPSQRVSKDSQRVKAEPVKKAHWKDAYFDYLKSKEWLSVRIRLFKLRGRKCEDCGATKLLQVHHITYARLFNESLSDLKILCDSCHKLEHGKLGNYDPKRKVKTTNVSFAQQLASKFNK